MEIWPAIDLRGGQCVRLQQGDYNKQTVFGANPAEMAQKWTSEGGRHLHLVDLDGAKDGKPVNMPSVKAILQAVDIPCELGGGIREEAVLSELFDAGLTRAVIGTLAIKQPEWFAEMCRKFPGKLVLGIDARNGLVATDGWLETSSTDAIALAKRYAELPLAAIVYTDIATDGMMKGPNVPAMAAMQAALDVPVVASGGVTTLDDVSQLKRAGMAGAIIGRSLYEGRILLKEAIAVADIQ